MEIVAMNLQFGFHQIDILACFLGKNCAPNIDQPKQPQQHNTPHHPRVLEKPKFLFLLGSQTWTVVEMLTC